MTWFIAGYMAWSMFAANPYITSLRRGAREGSSESAFVQRLSETPWIRCR
jgi:hypothetical protein